MSVTVEWGQARTITRGAVVVLSPDKARDWFGSHWEVPADGYVLTLDLDHAAVAITGTATELQSLAAALTTATAHLGTTDEPRDLVGELHTQVSELHALYADRDRFDDDYEDDYGTGLDSYDRHELEHLYAVAQTAEAFLGIPAFDFSAPH